MDYKICELPFDCTCWQSDKSFIEQGNNKIELFPSPFSRELSRHKYIKAIMQHNSKHNRNNR